MEFKHSFNDPLINPPKKRTKNNNKPNKATPLFDKDPLPQKNNILSRVSMVKSKNIVE